MFNRTIEQAVFFSDGLEVVSLTMDGEALIGKKIAARVALSKQAGLPNVGFASNGSLMSEDKAHELLDVGLDWISFSFDTLDKEVYEVERKRLKYVKTRDYILGFLRIRNKGEYKTRVNLRFLDHEKRKESFKEYQEFWGKYLRDGDQVHYGTVYSWYQHEGFNSEIPLSCSYPQKNIVVLRDGTIPLCCVDFNADVVFGNIMDTDLIDIWNSEKWQKVRQLHKQNRGGEVTRCVGCDTPDYEAGRELINVKEYSVSK